jgi:hypothetical protein
MPKSRARLPYTRWLELIDVVDASARWWSRPGSVLCQHVFDELCDSVEAEPRVKRQLNPDRADFHVIRRLGEELANEGAVIGLLHNEPDLIAPSIRIMKGLAFPKTVALLDAARALLPPPQVARRGTTARWDWLDSNADDPRHATLERLADRSEIVKDGWLVPCMKVVLSNPGSFFEDPDKQGFQVGG